MAHQANTPEDYDLFPETVVNDGAIPGYGNLWVAELKSFLTIAPEPNTSSVEGGLRIITGDHTFAATKGFRKMTLYRGDSQTDGTFPGDPGFKTTLYNVKAFVVGDDANTREFCEMLINKGVILLQTAPDCADTRILQHGCSCSPTVVKDSKFSSGGRISGGKKGYEITFESTCLFDYQGVVTARTA